MLGPWGFLPLATPGVLFVMARLGRRVASAGRSAERTLGGFVLTSALALVAIRLLGALGILTGLALLAALALAVVALAATGGPLPSAARERIAAWRARPLVTRATAPLAIVAASTLCITVVAARWIPVWQWDALGYHLPYVDFALVARSFRGVPADMPYVSTYPHSIEMLMIALRAMLPDDRLVDLAEVPFGVVGAVAIAGTARLAGASRPVGLAAGCGWIVAPAVFLQMPTDYVDVASAAFFLTAAYFVLAVGADPAATAKMHRTRILLAGVSLAIYVGTKPNAPTSAAVLAALLLWSAVRVKELPAGLVAMAMLALGMAPFIDNVIRFGNPVWPVEVKIGPLLLPGKSSMEKLLASGAMAPHLHGSTLSRVVRSWTTVVPPLPVFDMRIGGFGPLVVLAAPFAVATLLRRDSGPGAESRSNRVTRWGVLLASVVAPDPSVARYVLSFPGLLLAFAAPFAHRVPPRARLAVGLAAGALGLAQIAQALPGLTGDGPPLLAYASMTDD
ncbi:MAG TPA: hypothetical protein VHV30_14675, partial [Polyangiaceae bacterium]|nr:hypothetical protein [Polyangiaceae bacterium]